MIKRINEPISSVMTGPVTKPTIYSGHDKWGNSSGPTLVRIAEATMTATHLSSDLLWVVASNTTYPEFTIGDDTYQMSGNGIRIIYITMSFGFNTAVELDTTVINAGGDMITLTLGAPPLYNTVGLRASGAGGTFDFYPNDTNSLHRWHGSSNVIRLYAPRGASQPSNAFEPWESSDGAILSPGAAPGNANNKSDVITFDLLFP